ncbi:tyrosine-type recombinase/integrase [Paenibacillus sp. JTLBN-2024]
MKMVYPIRDKKQVEVVKSYLKSKSLRNYLMFQIGISSALRISDILSLKVQHVWSNRKPTDYIEVNEKKTGKYKRFPITPNLSKAIKEYAAENDMSDPDLFSSEVVKVKINQLLVSRLIGFWIMLVTCVELKTSSVVTV